jgi:hypothetical protein
MREVVRTHDSRWFAAWVVVGCALALSMLSVGLPLLIPVAVIAVLMIRRPGARRSAYGALIGVGLLLLFIAFANREGPGTACGQDGCGNQLNPLPWLLAGLAFVVGGFVAYRLRRH